MDKINQQIARKDQLDQERYLEMDKKMKKLQKKYNHVKSSIGQTTGRYTED